MDSMQKLKMALSAILIVFILSSTLSVFCASPELLGQASVSERTEKESLPLLLKGTITEVNPTHSRAVIYNPKTKTQGIYKIREEILGYRLMQIMRGSIILSKEGKLYKLEFPLGGEIEPIIVVSPLERIVNRSALLSKIPDLNTALRQGLPLLYIEGGKVAGIKIAKLKDKSLAKMTGVEEGDVLTSVNGQGLTSITQALALRHKLKDEPKISLEIKRGRELRTLIYHFN